MSTKPPASVAHGTCLLLRRRRRHSVLGLALQMAMESQSCGWPFEQMLSGLIDMNISFSNSSKNLYDHPSAQIPVEPGNGFMQRNLNRAGTHAVLHMTTILDTTGLHQGIES